MGVFMYGELLFNRRLNEIDSNNLDEVLEVYQLEGEKLSLKEEALMVNFEEFTREFFQVIGKEFNESEFPVFDGYSDFKEFFNYENRKYNLPYFSYDDSLVIYQDGGKYLMENDAILHHFENALYHAIKNPLRHALSIGVS